MNTYRSATSFLDLHREHRKIRLVLTHRHIHSVLLFVMVELYGHTSSCVSLCFGILLSTFFQAPAFWKLLVVAPPNAELCPDPFAIVLLRSPSPKLVPLTIVLSPERSQYIGRPVAADLISEDSSLQDSFTIGKADAPRNRRLEMKTMSAWRWIEMIC